ncbi:unnamed protein product [Urochloa decumbens]|uniref:Uncharacterized protein n=1 Tax=Urochloa decumbens TaxID=240449 RepID=A0ABC9HCV4_9POAL
MALAAGVVVVCSGDFQQQAVEPSSSLQRRSANYEPTTWDYDAICSRSFDSSSERVSDFNQLPMVASDNNAAMLTLKERVVERLLLKEEDTTTATASSRLRMIHQLQSLGIAYHFEQEIKAILLSMHRDAAKASNNKHDVLDLHSAALLFRMLREQGIPASTGDLLLAMTSASSREDDDHKANSDGLLALSLSRALAGQRLHDGHLQQQLPLHWRAPRLQAMWTLQKQIIAGDDDGETMIDPAILQLARVDFNQVQTLHQRELAEATRWWKETGLGEKLAFARERVVECFFCAACIAPEPHLADCREVLAKAGSLIVHLDDIYDVYGTPHELQAFTDAIGGWEHGSTGGDTALPSTMKAMYAAIQETSTVAAERVLHNHACHVLPLYKKAWHDLCKAFLVEARWHQQGYTPSFREYLANGWVTSTGPLLLLHALPAAAGASVLRAGGAPPRLLELSSTIFRLRNDCVSHQAESERGDVPSAIACCMAEKWCAGEEQAHAAIQGLIADTWKMLNKEMSSASADHHQSMPAVANKLCLNLARIIHCIYQDGDGITSPTHRIKSMITDLLFNPIPHAS